MTGGEMSWENTIKALADLQRRPSSAPITPKTITTGDISGSVAAIGDGAQVIVVQALSAAQQAQQDEDYDRQKLALAVAQQAEALHKQARIAPENTQSKHNPYKYLHPHSLPDFPLFFGRDTIIQQLLADLTCQDSLCRLAVLHGDAGIGKSSFIGAGIIPELVANQHFPLYVRMTAEPLPERIKRTLLPTLESTRLLKDIPLRDFLWQVAELLPEEKRLFILLDQFETFFDSPSDQRNQFVHELERCLFDSQGRDHWLISLRSAFVGHLSTFEPLVPFPTANSTALPPLNAEEARAAVLHPAGQSGITFSDDLLPVLLEDLGGDVVDPARLQLVCYTLTAGLEPGVRYLTMDDYQRVGRAEGIMHQHLNLMLEYNLPPRDQPAAWQILATLAEMEGREAAQSQLLEQMKTYGVDPARSADLIKKLENNWLIRSNGQRYFLSSESLLEPLAEWSRQRAALVQAREEGLRQLQRVRTSALRGMVAGMLGFSLAYILSFSTQIFDRSLLFISAAYRSLPGAVAGLLLVLFVDIAMASYHGTRLHLRWMTGGLAGAIGFSLSLLLHAFLNSITAPLPLLKIGLQGAIWGISAGLGVVWVLTNKLPRWQSLIYSSTACGLVFWITEMVGEAFKRPRLGGGGEPVDGLVFVSGAIMPALIMLAAAMGRSNERDESI
jgi:hypothetical protein